MRPIALPRKPSATRKLWLLCAGGLLAITVIQVPRLADLWRQLASQREQTAQMLAGLAESDQTQRLAQQVLEVQRELQAVESKMVAIEQMPAIQSHLMELARDSGCQLRKAAIQSSTSQTWELEEESRTGEGSAPPLPGRAPFTRAITAENPYHLTTEQISLTLTGTLTQTLDFMDRVNKQPWLMRVAQITFSREGEGNGELVVEANLTFHKLVCQEM